MDQNPMKPAAPGRWRLPFAIGLAVGIVIPMSAAVSVNLEPSIGIWGALVVSMMGAAVIGGLVAVGVCWLDER